MLPSELHQNFRTLLVENNYELPEVIPKMNKLLVFAVFLAMMAVCLAAPAQQAADDLEGAEHHRHGYYGYGWGSRPYGHWGGYRRWGYNYPSYNYGYPGYGYGYGYHG